MVHFFPRKLLVRMHVVRLPLGGEYKHQAYHELHTACGCRVTHGGFSHRGWTFTSNAEETTCGRCKFTREWRAEMRRLAREGIIDELPRHIP